MINQLLKEGKTLQELLLQVSNDLQTATNQTFIANKKFAAAQLKLETLKAGRIASIDPKTLGANETVRQANLNEMFKDEVAEVQNLSEKYQEASIQKELTRIKYDAFRYRLRIWEGLCQLGEEPQDQQVL